MGYAATNPPFLFESTSCFVCMTFIGRVRQQRARIWNIKLYVPTFQFVVFSFFYLRIDLREENKDKYWKADFILLPDFEVFGINSSTPTIFSHILKVLTPEKKNHLKIMLWKDSQITSPPRRTISIITGNSIKHMQNGLVEVYRYAKTENITQELTEDVHGQLNG